MSPTNKLRAVMAFLCENYPAPSELSNARLTKLVYLADWESARLFGRQITPTAWIFNHYGPWVSDVLETAQSDPAFAIEPTTNAFGSTKRQIVLKQPGAHHGALDPAEEKVLRRVINQTKKMYFGEFIDFVYSTHPVVSQSKYSSLDLVSLAREANALNPPEPLDPPGEYANVEPELAFQVRERVHSELLGLLDSTVSDEKQAQLPIRLHDASIEGVETQLELRIVADGDRTYDVTTNFDALLEGFVERSELESATENIPSLHVRGDWNEAYVWVAYHVHSIAFIDFRRSGEQMESRLMDFQFLSPA